ncbi:site-specific integrase [Rheinheimera salexigens]|uniref:Tyr recombinase domain-containing protein n=1 Tax=Rheinheimera salexigens TaxID=1628148 RepID=A0A1E7Q7C2_9GAMM|nr:site-specific integrase [Rheinheimera salexigens]OEY70085.1 hypothetical protein BI198_11290 [Rheinheimera salexigens]
MQIRSFINSLNEKGNQHPCLTEILLHVTKVEADNYRDAFYEIALTLNRLIKASKETETFDKHFLQKVIGTISTAADKQQYQRKTLEAILRYAQNTFGLSTAKVPQITEIRRDPLSLTLNHQVNANKAIKLFEAIKKDTEYPVKLQSWQQEFGRLAVILYLYEGVSQLSNVADVMRNYKVFYVGNIIYLQAPITNNTNTGVKKASSNEQRYIIGQYTALLFQLFLQKLKNDLNVIKPLNLESTVKSLSSRILLSFIKKYLSALNENISDSVTITALKSYRLTYWLLHKGAFQTRLLLKMQGATSLSEAGFIRLITNKAVLQLDNDMQGEPANGLEKDSAFLNGLLINDGLKKEAYLDIKHSVKLIKELIALIQKPSNWTNKKIADVNKAYEAEQQKIPKKYVVADSVEIKLKTESFKNNFYVSLYGKWVLHLLKYGGVKKATLTFRTIKGYASTLLKPFFIIFNDVDFSRLDDETLLEKLNLVAEIIPDTKQRYVYYLANYIQNIEVIPGFYAGKLDVISTTSLVDANILSVSQMETLLTKLHSAGEAHYDAILLLCLGFYTGMRRGEVCYIRLSDFEITQTNNAYDISIKIVPTMNRSLKSRAGTRSLQLGAFWPKRWLALLKHKLELKMSGGFTKSTLLFDKNVNMELSLISTQLRDYLVDKSFRYHNLRHSFVCWQFYRIILQQQLQKHKPTLPPFLLDDYFSEHSCQDARVALGLQDNSRKSVYALCAIVGHSEPQITFSSYFHLNEFFSYLISSSQLILKQVALSRLVRRAKIDETLSDDSFVDAIKFNFSDEADFNWQLSDLVLNSELLNIQNVQLKNHLTIPCLTQMERGFSFIGKLDIAESGLAIDKGNKYTIEESWLRILEQASLETQREYPKHGKKRITKYPDLPHSKQQLRSDKKISYKRDIYEKLKNKAQFLLDNNEIDESEILSSLTGFKGLLVAQAWLIQFKEPEEYLKFLEITEMLFIKEVRVNSNLYLPKSSKYKVAAIKKIWGCEPTLWQPEPPKVKNKLIKQPKYWPKEAEKGLMWLWFETERENGKVQKQTVVMNFIHFLIIACKTRLMIKKLNAQADMPAEASEKLITFEDEMDIEF